MIPSDIFIRIETKLGSSSCVICGKKVRPGNMTCGDDCHEKFVYKCEQEFGVYKKVTDKESGKIYKIPTRDIIETDLKWNYLPKYPLWEE